MKVCAIQFKREGNFERTVSRAEAYLEMARGPDFVLLGGELSLGESRQKDPLPRLSELARSYSANIIAPINANGFRSPPSGISGHVSMHMFGRDGEVLLVQDKHNFYPKEAKWFSPGNEVKVIEVDGMRIGLVRGMDIMCHRYCDNLHDADIMFLSTMAVDDMMFDLAKVRSLENRAYVAMASYIGTFMGMRFTGNAAIIEPRFIVRKGVPMMNQPVAMHRLLDEGLVQAEIDLGYIRRAKTDFPVLR